MTAKPTYGIFAALTVVAALLASCAPGSSSESLIATSVAQTVAAQETERALNSRLGPAVYQTYARSAGDWIEGLNQPDVQHRFSR